MSGGGGKVPKAPDLSGNISNANTAFNTATSNAGQVMNAAQGYNQNAQNTLSKVTGQQTPMLQKVNDASSQNLAQYGSTFVPLQQEQAQQAKDYTSDKNVGMLQGRAVADQNASLQSQLANQRASLASEGVDPASIHGGALAHQAAVQGAAGNAGAANSSYLNTMDTGRQLVAGANQLGLQVAGQGTQQAGVGSGIGSGIVGDTNATNAGAVNNLTAGNTYLNTGVNANQSGAGIASQGYQNQMGQYNAQQAQRASNMSLVGSAIGAASSFLEGGGPVLPAPSYAQGGPVSAKGAMASSPIPGSTDTKPAMLTPGEFVIPHDVAVWRGHEYWYKQMDKAREDKSVRHGLPVPPTSAWSARGH